MKSFDAYEKYIALRSHFDTSSKYDYFACNGKTRANINSFNKRSDGWMFGRLAYAYNDQEYMDLLIGNILHLAPNKIYVHMLLRPEARNVMLEYAKRIQSLSYTFSNDLDTLLDSVDKPDNIFKIVNGKNPPILNKFYNKEISKETFIILNNYFDFFPYFTKNLNDDFSWDYHRKSCLKYKPFIQYDREKFKSIIKDKIDGRQL